MCTEIDSNVYGDGWQCVRRWMAMCTEVDGNVYGDGSAMCTEMDGNGSARYGSASCLGAAYLEGGSLIGL